jgi:hypothetical protein
MKAEPKASIPAQTAKNETGDFAQFTDFMRRLVSVPPEVVRERIKAAKKPRGSASRVPVSSKTAQ